MSENLKNSKLIALLIVFLCIFVRVVPAFMVYGTEDVSAVKSAVTLLEEGKDPYSQHYTFNQSPFWVQIIYEMSRLVKIFNIPYHFVIKILPIISDAIISIIIYRASLNLNPDIKKAIKASLFYALNPVSIIITSIHGNLVSIQVCFLLISVYILYFYKSRFALLYSSLAMGLAVMSKIWPIFFLVPMLQKIKGFKNKIIYVLFSGMPLLISLLPLYIKNKALVTDNFLKYQSIAGWWGVTGISTIFNYQFMKDLSYFYASNGSLILCCAVIILYLVKTGRMDLFKGFTLINLSFLFFTPGFGPQYLVWILPFVILDEDKMFYPFTAYITILFIIEYWFRPFLGNIGTYISGNPVSMTIDQFTRDNKLTNILRLPLWIFIGVWFSMAISSRAKSKYKYLTKYANNIKYS